MLKVQSRKSTLVAKAWQCEEHTVKTVGTHTAHYTQQQTLKPESWSGRNRGTEVGGVLRSSTLAAHIPKVPLTFQNSASSGEAKV